MIVATDGYVEVEPEAFELIRSNLNKANLFAFGIGTGVNRHLIEGMAHVGGGEPFVITSPQGAAATAEKFREYIQSPVLTNIKCDFGNFAAYDVEPVSIPDVMALRPIIIFGKWKGSAQGTISLSGITGRNDYSQQFDVNRTQASVNNIALRYLWARSKIAMLGDFNVLREDDSRIKEITSLGLQYNLLTAYTSFVAIDNEIRNKDGTSQTVKQALPLPEGVSDYAVGGEAQSRCKMMKQSMGYGGAMPAAAAAPEQSAMYCKDKAMSVDALGKKEECKKGITTEKKKSNIPVIDPASVKVEGKTIMYFWTNSCTACLDEIEAIIRFAAANAGVNVVVVNIDKNRDSQTAKRALFARLMLVTIPANVSFGFDTAAATAAKFGAPSNPHVLPVTLFLADSGLVRSVYGALTYWNDAVKVMENFNK